MAQNQNPPAPTPPGPDPALKRLERFVGTWTVTGRTLDAHEDNVSGRFTFEWLPGGFFLQQRTELNFAGYQVQGLEVIGYDPATDKFPSTVYSSMVGVPRPGRTSDSSVVSCGASAGSGFAPCRGRWRRRGPSHTGSHGRRRPGWTPTRACAWRSWTG